MKEARVALRDLLQLRLESIQKSLRETATKEEAVKKRSAQTAEQLRLEREQEGK